MVNLTSNLRIRQLVIVAVVLSFVGLLSSSSVSAQSGGGDKVTLCHATAGVNTYERITVAAAGAANGHGSGGHRDGNDIIPPFTFNGQTYSQNWDARGQAIFNNGCVVPAGAATGRLANTGVTPIAGTLAGLVVVGSASALAITRRK